MSSKHKSSKRQSRKAAQDSPPDKGFELDLSFDTENFSGFDAALDDLKGSFFSKSSESKGEEYFDNFGGAFEESEGKEDMNQAFVVESSILSIEEDDKEEVKEKIFGVEIKPEIKEAENIQQTKVSKAQVVNVVAIERSEIGQSWWCQSCLIADEKRKESRCILF
ncbi:unnamed protein product [Blepharisma stoltei]|uniref:Uncharacterized protein n=1 Tax=Blepharisma stoltei TaxID=1481888 RepID=A0AAU9J917_9CILI|nr:unnamed protein product [Blepharisma stoltei]